MKTKFQAGDKVFFKNDYYGLRPMIISEHMPGLTDEHGEWYLTDEYNVWACDELCELESVDDSQLAKALREA